MKEININIEGYNVNGVCVGCLNYNRKMYYDDEVKECFKTLAKIDVPDGLTIQVCWECLAAVRRIMCFQSQILNVHNVLMEYSKQHTFLNSPKDLTIYAHNRLSTSPVQYTDWQQSDDDGVDITQVDMEFELKHETKSEPVIGFNDDDASVKDEYEETDLTKLWDEPDLESSDEDLQLSQIKDQKQKQKKVKKKKKDKEKTKTKVQRKLKNLPDIIELHTMTEEEMCLVRQQDVLSDSFQRLKHRCDHCVIGFNTERLRQTHHNRKHKPKSTYQCDVCKAYFLSSDSCGAHRSLHLAAYRCSICGVVSTLKRRMLEHSCAKDSVREEHPCTYCDKVFSSKSKLSYHRAAACLAERPQCDCCGKVFANKMTLKYHLKLLPLKKEDKPKEKLYIPCKGCSKVFTSKKSYRAHVVIHEGRSYPCPICGKLFMWKRNLSRHTRAHNDRDIGQTHQCRECNKTFASRDCYNNHMRLSKRHASESTYVHECNYCGKKFPTKWCLVDHVDWEHLKTIKYQCSICFKAFKTAKIMVAHMNNIHGGRRAEPDGDHLCDVCGKSYKTVKRLKAHVWAMHTSRSSAKSYKCSLCAASFTWQTSIYKHMKMMHHNKRPNKLIRVSTVKKHDSYAELQNFMNTLQPIPNAPLGPNIIV